MQFKIRLEGKEQVKAWLKLKPVQINRASRITINQVTRELHKQLGGEIPKVGGTSVVGYRRVRAKKKLAKAGRTRIKRGITWMGTLDIPAKYAGRPRKTKDGVKVGRHFFTNAFVVTMKNGYTGVFYRLPGNKLEQAMIELPQSDAQAKSAATWANQRASSVLRSRLQIELAKKV